jgi:hypothetical protein
LAASGIIAGWLVIGVGLLLQKNEEEIEEDEEILAA